MAMQEACEVEFQSSKLRIERFVDKKPTIGANYFHVRPQNVEKTNREVLCLGVAFYNEDPIELSRSLRSLAEQQQHIERDGNVYCDTVIVSDGHKQMHRATKVFLKALFCAKHRPFLYLWQSMLQELDRNVEENERADSDEKYSRPTPLTFVVQRFVRGSYAGEWIPESLVVSLGEEKEVRLRLCLIVKADNRRKHNSGQWMMSPHGGFASAMGASYVFLTDCGTLFVRDCIAQLVRYMRNNPRCVGCTARPRVMNATEQGNWNEGFSLAGFFFRLVQMTEYESTFPIFQAAFSLFGCVPVLPGPCTLIRYDSLVGHFRNRSERDPLLMYLDEFQGTSSLNGGGASASALSSSHFQQQANAPNGNNRQHHGNGLSSKNNHGVDTAKLISPYEHFEDLIETPIEDTDIVRENMKIAEDRIPSYAVVTHGRHDTPVLGDYTTWVTGLMHTGPVFKFQAELEIATWIAQRRRWINGAFCVYCWLVMVLPQLIWKSNMFSLRKLGLWFLNLLQLFNYLFSTLSCAVLGGAMFVSLNHLEVPPLACWIIIGIFFVITFFFAWIHRYSAFSSPVFYFVAIVNAAAICIILVALFSKLDAELNSWRNPSLPRMDAYGEAILFLSVSMVGIPFIVAIVALDVRSLGYLLLGFIPYVLFLPTLVGTFTLYSIARLGDTSWGNRATSRSSFAENVLSSQLGKLQAQMSAHAAVALLFVTVANAGLLAVVALFYTNRILTMSLVAIVSGPTFIQLALCVVFIVFHQLNTLFGLIAQRFKRCCSRKASMQKVATEDTILLGEDVL